MPFFNLFAGNLSRKVIPLARRFGFDFLPPLPTAIQVEPTNLCNLRCPACPTGSGKMNRPGRLMGEAEFRWLIDQVRGHATKLTLWNYGEPLLNRHLPAMIRYAVAAGMEVRTSTNGDFLRSAELCRKLVRSGLQDIIVCLDGADQATLDFYRRGSSLADILQGLRHLRDSKRKFGLKTPKIHLQLILMRHNIHQKNQLARLAEELGVDYYSEKVLGLDCNDPDFQPLADRLLPDDLADSRFERKADGTIALKGEMVNGCDYLYSGTVINADGSVVPCPYDHYSDHVMGNAFRESLREIWQGARYEDFRHRVQRDRRSIRICQACPQGRCAIHREVAVGNG